MTKYLLDANVLIRFLRGDHSKHAAAAQSLFSEACAGNCSLILTEVVVAETVWVLNSVYSVDRRRIALGIQKVILSAGVRCINRNEMIDALDRFASTKCDFIDCYLAALAAQSGDHVASFDKDFKRFPDVQRCNHQT
jgi:predicted nucleic acid-binding protein